MEISACIFCVIRIFKCTLYLYIMHMCTMFYILYSINQSINQRASHDLKTELHYELHTTLLWHTAMAAT